MYFGFLISLGNTAFTKDDLNVNRMNVWQAESLPSMQDTYYNSRLQRMVVPDGTTKGIKQRTEDMREKLQSMHNFKYQKTKVETLLVDGYTEYFIPKFHCELNPIDRVWAQSTEYSRANCDYSFKGLEEIIEFVLDSVWI